MSDTKIIQKTAFLICGERTYTFKFDTPSEFLHEVPNFILNYDDYDIPCDLIVIEERDCRPKYKEHIFPFDGAMELVEFIRGIQFQLHYIDDYEMPTVDWDMLGCGEEDSVQKDNTIKRNKAMLTTFMRYVSRAGMLNDCSINSKLVQDEPDTLGLRFSFGVITFFDDGTWSLNE